jgi:1,6-anhydro-N-acetylmuramate kinase
MDPARPRFIAGVMTGTSLDGIDVAIVRVEGRGLDLRAALLYLHSDSLGDLPALLRPIASGTPAEPINVLRAARRLGECYARAIAHAASAAGVTLDLVSAHGQTVWHAPQEHLSWQLLDPWPIVRQVRVPVVYDLRQADLIAGGQGAPITPLSDWILFRDAAVPRLIVNLGGICNVTALPAGAGIEAVRGYDAGPCNLVLDGAVRLLYPGQAYDDGGRLAASGTVRDDVRPLLRQSPFFARPSPRTTGREDFSDAFVRRLVQSLRERGWSPADVLATLVDAVAAEIAACAAELGRGLELVLAGGAVRNATLVSGIARHGGDAVRVRHSDALGVPAAAREALAMAVLAALCQDRVPITLPAVTGAIAPSLAGAWIYP